MKKIAAFLLLALLISGCAREDVLEDELPEEIILAEIDDTYSESSPGIEPELSQEFDLPIEPIIFISTQNARPGESITVIYSDDFLQAGNNLRAVLLNAGGRVLNRAVFNTMPLGDVNIETKTAFLGIPNTVTPGNFSIRVETDDKVIMDFPLTIEGRTFFSQTLYLNPANTEIRTAPNPQRNLESDQLWAILARTGTDYYDFGPYIRPISSTRITSNYGDRRVYQYSDGTSGTTIHAGVDYGIPIGTPVWSSGRGRVVLASNRIVTGYTIVIEHLPGLYSLYYHLDSLLVSAGDIVERGQYIAASGNTGLSTGPHLHWEIRVSTEYLDPYTFITQPVLDINQIINRIRSMNTEQ